MGDKRPTKESHRARKRARQRERKLELQKLRAVLALELSGDVPEHMRGLNAEQTRRAVDVVRLRRSLGQPASEVRRRFI